MEPTTAQEAHGWIVRSRRSCIRNDDGGVEMIYGWVSDSHRF
jgi:hypothetical protein